jgi:hypothetical protein|tara:strand:+ start:2137 stop:2307 length:171 start_codon:yes stop_codon:yes gene_type:complete
MKIKGATTVLNKECTFLGMTLSELLIFIERNPYAFSYKTIEALNVYKQNLLVAQLD